MKTYPLRIFLKSYLSAWLLTSASILLSASYPAVALEMTDDLRNALLAAVTVDEQIVDDWDAQVWLMGKDTRLQAFISDEDERLSLIHAIHAEARRTGLPTELVMAVIEVESRFDPYAISSAGAQGLMQVMAFWKNELGRTEDNLVDIRTNLRYGCTILAYYRRMEHGDLESALARYNGSYGETWYAERVMDAMSQWR
jgi:membrane-bound lytic murein transglycosylase MltF